MISSFLSTASDQLTVEFPNIFHGMEIVYSRSFTVFGVNIFWYGILIAVGVALAYIYAMRRVTRDFGIVKDRAFDVIFAAVIGGFLFARIYYCVFRTLDPNSGTKYNFITTFTTIRDGGIAIYGGIIGAVVIGLIFCRIRRVNFFAMADLASLGFLIGQCIGRWGNFVNQEAYGDFCSPDWVLGMTGSRIAEEMGSSLPVHPCFLYESTWCLLGFIFLHIYSKKLRSFDGEIALLYVAWYGFGRMFIEGLRTDSLYWGSFRVSQVLAAISFAAAIILFVIFKFLTKKKGAVLYVNSAASKELIRQDLEAERLRKAKKNKKAPSILGDDTEKSASDKESAEESSPTEESTEEPAPTEESAEESDLTEDSAEESDLTEDSAEEAAPTEESAEEPALTEDNTEESAPTEESAEESDLTEDSAEESAPTEDSAEENPSETTDGEKKSDEAASSDDDIKSNDK